MEKSPYEINRACVVRGLYPLTALQCFMSVCTVEYKI